MTGLAIRSGRGLGDSLYLQSIARHLVGEGRRPLVVSDWPAIFDRLDVPVVPFRRSGVDIVAHYVTRKEMPGSTIFEDMCIAAEVPRNIPLRLERPIVDRNLVADVLLAAGGRPIVLVQQVREPFGRSDGYGMDLLPRFGAVQKIIDRLKEYVFLVEVGAGTSIHEFRYIGLNLVGRTSVSQLLDLARSASGLLGYCSFFVPLAESLSKPSLLIWSARGLRSPVPYIRSITPTKILHRPDLSRWVLDECSESELCRAADAFLDTIGSAALV